MIKNYDQSVDINHNPNWFYIPDHHHKILIIGGSGSGKTDVLQNLIKNQRPDTDKIIYMSKIHSNQSVNCLLMEEKKQELRIQQTIDNVYENVEDYIIQ